MSCGNRILAPQWTSVYSITPATAAGAIASWKARMIQGGDASADAMVFVQKMLGKRASLMGFVMKGFTDATPNLCAGLTASLRL